MERPGGSVCWRISICKGIVIKRRLCVTMLLIPVIRLQAAHFKGGGRCANKLGRRYMM